jgi:hypothetical protein
MPKPDLKEIRRSIKENKFCIDNCTNPDSFGICAVDAARDYINAINSGDHVLIRAAERNLSSIASVKISRPKSMIWLDLSDGH